MSNYESPILIEYENAEKMLSLKVEDAIYEAVLKCNIKVDKDELWKALEYDRDQYEKGFAEGRESAVKHAHWIVKPTRGTINKYKCHCSACGNGYEADAWHDPIDLDQAEWCLWCGAKMDEEVLKNETDD